MSKVISLTPRDILKSRRTVPERQLLLTDFKVTFRQANKAELIVYESWDYRKVLKHPQNVLWELRDE